MASTRPSLPVSQSKSTGAKGREEATGRGVGIMALKALKRMGIRPQDCRTAIQGFGNVGSHAAKFMSDAEFPIVAVSDISGCYYNENGLDILSLFRYMTDNGTLKGYKEAELMDGEELLCMDVDLLIPAALGGVIHEGNVDKIQAKLIIEAANGPTLPSAHETLTEAGIIVLPDILANAGGVTVSYFDGFKSPALPLELGSRSPRT